MTTSRQRWGRRGVVSVVLVGSLSGSIVAVVGAVPATAAVSAPTRPSVGGATAGPATSPGAVRSKSNSYCQPTAKKLCPENNTVWSGYVVSPLQNRQFRSVSASWVQPVATCRPKTSPSAWSLFWVGLDGWSSSFDGSTVEQGGSYAQCVGTSHVPVYSVWWEMFPTNDIVPEFAISAHDHIDASVTFDPTAETYTVSVTDDTSGQSMLVVATSQTAAVNPNTYTVTVDGVTTGPTSFAVPGDQSSVLCSYAAPCQNGSAEWVVEAPGGANGGSNSTHYPLARFRPMVFTSATATDSAGNSGPILDAAWSPTALDLTTWSGLYLASVTQLKSNGGQFRDVWVPAN